MTVVVNEAARLQCEATGVPLPSLTWLKDGSPVASVSHGIQVCIHYVNAYQYDAMDLYFDLNFNV